jgi:hypothetical protein
MACELLAWMAMLARLSLFSATGRTIRGGRRVDMTGVDSALCSARTAMDVGCRDGRGPREAAGSDHLLAGSVWSWCWE